MKIEPPLEQGLLLRRYKRFFCDIELPDHASLTIHCPNTGSMKNCLVANSVCWHSRSNNPKRKLPGTLEIATSAGGYKVGVNTARPNHLVREAIENGTITELQGYDEIQSEVRYGIERSRIDLLLRKDNQQCYVEVKNVTLEDDNDPTLLRFPDAVTSRGTKHLRELMGMVAQGHRAVLVFCLQHEAAKKMRVAGDIDPEYENTLREAIDSGVEILAYRCLMTANEIAIRQRVPFANP